MTQTQQTAPKAKEDLPFGWEISDKIVPEIAKSFDVWSVFSPAGGFVPKDSLNLGQGFMSWNPPEFIRQAASDVLSVVECNHYSIPRGRARLRAALSELVSESFNLPEGRKIDPATEILVTAGANEGMYAYAAAFIRPGDEVILFEPYFDQYTAQITFNGGVPVFVPIHAPEAAATSNVSASEWKINLDELRAAITPKTKMIWLNTPHNPVGKVFDEEELRAIGNIAEEFNLMILSDEVVRLFSLLQTETLRAVPSYLPLTNQLCSQYDVLTFDSKPHLRIASLDNFYHRTITVGSAGKSFSATGWRIGWLIGPAPLIRASLAAHTRIVFTASSPSQEASAIGIEMAIENGFFKKQVGEYEERRAVLIEGLDKLGLPYTVPDGAYFILVNTARLEIPEDFPVPDMIKGRARDWKAAWFIAQTAGVVCIPPTDFYSEPHWSMGENFIRLAFCKDVDVLRAASERLLKLKPYIRDA
ncbi:kynurenine aminotransferase, partial [Phenoliferia sp. Uapishka_3]